MEWENITIVHNRAGEIFHHIFEASALFKHIWNLPEEHIRIAPVGVVRIFVRPVGRVVRRGRNVPARHGHALRIEPSARLHLQRELHHLPRAGVIDDDALVRPVVNR